ncbi:DNA/RNA polymerase [Agrocybe pediades]|nr:DNA/RNA polymerase [Agrocybe pediades]
MIPRTATRRLETTLLCARQALPRPARLYSTPSQKLSAPATAAATSTYIDSGLPPFLTTQNATKANGKLRDFLSRDPSYVLVPTPEPAKAMTMESDRWFGDPLSLDMTGIIDACLHNLYDVPRAMDVFTRLRERIGSVALDTPLYNAFLLAYSGMAEKDSHKKAVWLGEAWSLYTVMEKGLEQVHPNAKTYSIMLSIWHQSVYISSGRRTDPGYLLTKLLSRNISVLEVVGNPCLKDPKLIAQIAQTLAVQAVQLKFPQVVEELGQGNVAPPEEDVFATAPEINPVTKSVSVNGEVQTEIPFNISGLRRQLNKVIEARSFLKQDAYARQRHLEASVYDLAKERLEHTQETLKEVGVSDGNLANSQLRKWMFEWHKKLREALRKEMVKIEKQEESFTKPKQQLEKVSAHLKLVNPDRLSLLTILEVMRLHGSGGITGGMKTTRALIAVGKAVENEHKAQICKNNQIPIPDFGPRTDLFTVRGYQNLHQRRAIAAKTMADAEDWTAPWSQALRVRIGSILVSLLIEVADIVQEMVDPRTNEILSERHPAFYQSYEYVRGQKLGVLKLHEQVLQRLAKDSLDKTIHPRHLPMLVKPRPWTDYNQGGYLYSKSYAMRFKDSHEQQVHLREATAAGNVELVFAGLDVLGSTPWKVNKDIFETVTKVWNTGERMGKIPPAVYDQPEPVMSEESAKDLMARSHHMQRHKAWTQHKNNNHSDRCSVNYKIEIARAFLHDTLYLPHNLDFRGRAYPLPPHLNHMGDDLSRSLLLFDEAKPLGVRGMRWLKIHAANLYGYDKANFDDRVAWTEKHLDKMIEAATNPLEGEKWWLAADEPWQFLATCIEMKKAHELEDPTTYCSSLPVHQDGTCNGLQHYAALGGDAEGAAQVNLAAADKPSDVYTYISHKVQKTVAEDAAKGVEVAQLLVNNISRKVVKQTVMTTVYGVTFVGAREQIEKQLKDRTDVPEEKCWGAASYLAKVLLATIGDTFKGAKDIQNWLNLCARLISKSIPEDRLALERDEAGNKVSTLKRMNIKKQQMTSVVWTTALGLPIVQPYRKAARKQVQTAIQSVFISDPRAPSEVNAAKQASAFPPNFIHSLDATHMLLTALECRNKGLTFASIHDSYWTHACDVDTMSAVIRDTFIALHSSNILERLDKEFRQRYATHQIPLSDLRASGRAGGESAEEEVKSTESESEVQEEVEIDPYETPKERVARLKREAKAAAAKARLEAKAAKEAAKAAARKEAAEKRAAMEAQSDLKLLDNKFIRLVDLIPPLPKKGDFEVEEIKASPYFFS